MSKTEPNHPDRSTDDPTQPVEVQHYGPAQPREPMHRSSWNEAPSWSSRRPSVQAVEVRRGGMGVVPVITIAIVAGILSGALAAVAMTNVLDEGSGSIQPAAATASPDSQPVSDVRIDESSAVIEATSRVAPAVVTIDATGGGLLGPATGTGSGVIFDADGWILTNRHVVEDRTLQVTLNDGRVFDGTVYGLDTLTDLAIVKIEGDDLPTAPIGTSSDLQPGQLAIAIGNPLGYDNTVTTGIVSGLGRQILASDAVQASDPEQLRNLIQTDAAINPGNSGGPLVNSVGQIIGINTAVSTTAQGLGFAIPIDVARPIMEQAVAGEPLTRPYMGVWYTPVNAALAETEDLPVDHGAYIAAASVQEPVIAGSPADAAGLQAGDVIVAINGEQLPTDADLSIALLPYAAGDTITMRVLRDNSVSEIDLTLEVQPDN